MNFFSLSFSSESQRLPPVFARGIAVAKAGQKLMAHGNILLVDDDPGFLTALTKTLTKHGYAVTSAADASNAVEEIARRETKFDLLITDLSMPVISGVTLLNAFKTAFPDVPVVVITAFGDELTETNALRDGAFAFVHKPLDLEEFLGVIERALKVERPNTV